MNPENAELYDAMKAYVQDALGLVSSSMPAPPELLERVSTYARQPGFRMFGYRPLHVLLPSLMPKLTELSTRNRCLELIKTDPKLSLLVDALVGTEHQRKKLTAEEILDSILMHLNVSLADCSLDEKAFDRCYGHFEKSFYGESMKYEVIAPLAGFDAPDSIVLDDKTDISRLSREETDLCSTLLPYQTFIPPRFAVKARYEMPRIVGDAQSSGQQQGAAVEGWARAVGAIYGVLQALSIFKRGECGHLGVVSRCMSWINLGYQLALPDHPPDPLGRPRYQLSAEEGEQFTHFWTDFARARVKRVPWAGVAISRFDDATHRPRPEDALLDLMIAAEALFLSGAGDPQERGELSFRLALRASTFCSKDGSDAREIYELFRDAYRLRSKLVHGGSGPNPAKVSRVVQALEEKLRWVLQETVQRLEEGSSTRGLADWEALLFKKLGAGTGA